MSSDSVGADVSLVFIEPTGRPLAKKVIQRLDGIWFSPNDFHTKNERIKDLYLRTNSVVFQSNFDKEMITKWWGHPRSSHVIYNGVSSNFVQNESLDQNLTRLRKSYTNIFVCSANWHGQKRLPDNVRLFQHLKSLSESSCLLVLGNNAPDIQDRDIYVLGSLPHDACMQVYRASDWMIHLAWADHCPNVVVEALSQGTPVICAETGGTKELVGSYGIVLKENVRYNFELFDYSRPPTIEVSQIDRLLDRKSLDFGEVKTRVDIETSTLAYIDAIKELIK